MYYFEYFDYSNYHKLIFCGNFSSITEADKAFKKETGKDASKNSNIGCTVKGPNLFWKGAEMV